MAGRRFVGGDDDEYVCHGNGSNRGISSAYHPCVFFKLSDDFGVLKGRSQKLRGQYNFTEVFTFLHQPVGINTFAQGHNPMNNRLDLPRPQ